MPKALDKVKRLNEYMGYKMQDGKALDPKFRQFTETTETDEFMEQNFAQEDTPHPTEEGRTLDGDLAEMLNQLEDKAKREGAGNNYQMSDFQAIERKLRREYE